MHQVEHVAIIVEFEGLAEVEEEDGPIRRHLALDESGVEGVDQDEGHEVPSNLRALWLSDIPIDEIRVGALLRHQLGVHLLLSLDPCLSPFLVHLQSLQVGS